VRRSPERPPRALLKAVLALGLPLALLAAEQGAWTLIDLCIPSAAPRALAQPRNRRRPSKKAELEVSSLTDGAEVYVDGERVGVIPLESPIQVDPGEHVIKVSKRGYVDYLETHVIKKGRKPYVVEADLLPFSGILIIQTRPSPSQVLVDGALAGETPFEGEVESGERTITVRATSYTPHEEQRLIIAGETYFLDLDLHLEPPPLEETAFYTTWWFWTGVAVVLAGGTVAAFTLGGDDTPADTRPPVDGTIALPLSIGF